MTKYKNKELFVALLGNFVCNISDIIEDILEKDDWGRVDFWEPYEKWDLEELQDHIFSIYEDVINLTDYATPKIEDILEWWNSLPIQDIYDCKLGWANLTMQYFPEKEDCYNLTEEEIKTIYNKLYKK